MADQQRFILKHMVLFTEGLGLLLSGCCHGHLASHIGDRITYLVMVPHAIRSPAFPAGSVFRSSALAWTTSAVPPLLKTERLSSPISAFRFASVAFAVPSCFTVKFNISPACGPSGFCKPCFLLSGLKWGPADLKSGASHLAF